MDYSKLLLFLCLFIALVKTVPLPPLDPASLLGDDIEEEGDVELPPLPPNTEGVDLPPIPPNTEEVDLPPIPPNTEEVDLPPIPPNTEEVDLPPIPPNTDLPDENENEEVELPPLPPNTDLPGGDEDTLPPAELEIDSPEGADAPFDISLENPDGPVEVENPAQPEEPIYVDPEADQEPQDISTDTNGAVADNIGNITNEIIGIISYAIKSSLENELGTEANDESTNGFINNVVVDLFNKHADEIKSAIGEILNNDINNGDYESIASEAANKVADILSVDILDAIASNLNFNLDFEKISDNVLNGTTENVKEFIMKSLETSDAVVDDTLTNETSDDIAISNANDIATMVTNGVSYIIKNNLCESLGEQLGGVCENLANTIIVSIAGILNNIVTSSIDSASGNGLTIACSIIPSDVFKELTGVVTEAITGQFEKNGNVDTENINKIANNILTIIINAIEDLLCADRQENDFGSVIIKDIGGLASHIINRVNSINDEVTSTLNDENTSENAIGGIATGFSDLQNTIKDSIEG